MGQLAGEIVQSRETFSFSSVIWHIVQYGCMLIEMIPLRESLRGEDYSKSIQLERVGRNVVGFRQEQG